MEIEETISAIENQDSVSIDESFSFAKVASILLRSDGEKGRKIIIYILDNWGKLPDETREIWTDLIESAGFYPYLEKEKEKLKFNNLSGEIRKGCHFSESLGDKYFHEEQKYLKDILDNGKNLIVSAPTSFGKSLLIEDMVANKKFKNIVVIQPTLALLDETRKKLRKYKDDYKIIVRTSQGSTNEKGNLFLLTAERVMEYDELPPIDFFVIDEFYKLSAKRDDERSDVLNNAFYKLLQQTPVPQFYLLGPNIDSISEGFAERYHAKFYKTNYSLIENKIEDIYSLYKAKFSKPRKYKEFKEEKLFELLLELKDEQSIIYCSSPSRVRELAGKFSLFLEGKNIDKVEKLPLIEWVEKNINPKWNLINFLNFGIGINDGALHKHINSSMIDYFNNKKLKYIFCTSTIIEGVNTSAKNVIFFDPTKGNCIPIDYFDYSNIKGRSGRMMIHYIGKIYNFNPPPEKEDMFVDIPFYQQNPVKDEVLNNLMDSDIKIEVKDSEQYKDLLKIPQAERSLFQKNGVLIKGQKKILDIISDLDKTYLISRKNSVQEYKIYDLINWTSTPSYDQLQFCLEICWNNLMKDGESKKVKSIQQLILLTFNYGYKKNIFQLVQDNFVYSKTLKANKDKTDDVILNESIEEIFNVMRHWFQYKIPKWLSVMNELQKYVCSGHNKPSGNYSFYASQIENEFIPNELSILHEYGIPASAIKKIESELVNKHLTEDEVIIKTKDILNKESNLLDYEKERIRVAL